MNRYHLLHWRNLRSPQLGELAQKNAVVLLPVGSTEQHGPHLSVETDSRLAEEICIRTARKLTPQHAVVVAPTVWCGLSEHHMAYPGTISVRFETFLALLRDVCEAIQRHGFTRIMIVNGHGGNVDALRIIVGKLTRDLMHPVRALTYCTLSDSAEKYSEILEDQQGVLHAGEAETSMMLVLAEEHIDKDAMLNAPNKAFGAAKNRDVYSFIPYDQLSKTGVNGITKNASSQKGELLLEAGATAVSQSVVQTFGL